MRTAGKGRGASRGRQGRPRRRRGGGGARRERRASVAPIPATTQHAPPMPSGPSCAAVADDGDELSHLLSLAEADLDDGHLRAARLDPDSPRASLLLTAVSVLVADHTFHRATLLAIASGVGLDEGGGEQGGVDGVRDDGPRRRREGGLGRRRRAVGGW
uniref:Uncharacterized protein n=1 Tax=Oryza meridionalis TaxID=40149 RepID=A0A0E0F3Y5_9ORYZ